MAYIAMAHWLLQFAARFCLWPFSVLIRIFWSRGGFTTTNRCIGNFPTIRSAFFKAGSDLDVAILRDDLLARTHALALGEGLVIEGCLHLLLEVLDLAPWIQVSRQA